MKSFKKDNLNDNKLTKDIASYNTAIFPIILLGHDIYMGVRKIIYCKKGNYRHQGKKNTLDLNELNYKMENV